MGKDCLMIQLRPRYLEERAKRTYKEENVKHILFAFARDIGCKWSDAKLKAFIESVFDFDS